MDDHPSRPRPEGLTGGSRVGHVVPGHKRVCLPVCAPDYLCVQWCEPVTHGTLTRVSPTDGPEGGYRGREVVDPCKESGAGSRGTWTSGRDGSSTPTAP